MHNLQGDVIGIFDSVGEDTIVRYTYDEWGKVLTITGDQASTIGQLNPIRYRSYYYDTETGFYYCRSRYYDPEICRWINADGQMAGIDGEVLGYNQFAYCFNNPINLEDSTGNWPNWVKKAANAVKTVVKKTVKAVKKAVKAIKQFGEDISKDISKLDMSNTDVEETYESNYVSAYRGALVIRHSIEGTTSCAIGGIIFLNRNENGLNPSKKSESLNHEYGHILQEREFGTIEYAIKIAIPSVTYYFASQYNQTLFDNYYNMPWEYNADMRGGVNRGYTTWANDAANAYFFVWDVVEIIGIGVSMK